jgi:DNA-binding MurR/RpiR family transcriptional regulator
MTRSSSAKQELTRRIGDVYADLSPKKRRIADFILKDYKRLFLMTARELAQSCGVSEPTVMRFAIDLGFSGYLDFEKFIKGLLHIELTAVERLSRTDARAGGSAPLRRYCLNAISNLESLMKSVTPLEQRRLAKALFSAKKVTIVGFRASSTLAQYFGYLLNKVRANVTVATSCNSELMDHIAVAGSGHVLFAIAFPRYPLRTIEMMEYAKAMGSKVIGLTDAHTSPIVTRSDHYVVIDLEGISFIDPLEHVIAFLGSLAHEIAFLDQTRTTERLKLLERGLKARNEYYSEEIGEDGTSPAVDLLNSFGEP